MKDYSDIPAKVREMNIGDLMDLADELEAERNKKTAEPRDPNPTVDDAWDAVDRELRDRGTRHVI